MGGRLEGSISDNCSNNSNSIDYLDEIKLNQLLSLHCGVDCKTNPNKTESCTIDCKTESCTIDCKTKNGNPSVCLDFKNSEYGLKLPDLTCNQ